MVYGGEPALSFDGTRIAFAQAAQLFVMNSDGTRKDELTHAQVAMRLPAWSPDDETIAFIGLRKTAHSENFDPALYLIRSNGTGLRQLTEIAIAKPWSPIGKFISFIDPHGQALTLSDTKENLRQLTDLDLGAPAWSPDGKLLAFTGLDKGSPEIFVMDLETSAIRQVTHLRGTSTSPTWSPDGKKVAFAFDDFSKSRIFVADAKGDSVRELIAAEKFQLYEPAWSPNGREVAVTVEPNIGNPHLLKDQSAGHASFARGR